MKRKSATIHEKKEAIKIILNDTENYAKTLDYAVHYCLAALRMTDEQYFNTQVLYILNNIIYWRHPQAKFVRQILKAKTV